MGGGEDGYTPAFERIDDAAAVMRLLVATKARVEANPWDKRQ